MTSNFQSRRLWFIAIATVILSTFIPVAAHSLEIRDLKTHKTISGTVTILAGQTTRWRVNPIPHGGPWPKSLFYKKWRADAQFKDNGDGSRDFIIKPSASNQRFSLTFTADFDGKRDVSKTITVQVARSGTKDRSTPVKADFSYQVEGRTVWVKSTVPTSTYPASAGLKYFWYFNDRNDPDNLSSYPNGMGGGFSHYYSQDGRYTIALKVCDIFDLCDSVQRVISIPDNGPIAPPAMTACRNPRSNIHTRDYKPVCAYHPINNRFLIYSNKSVACSNRNVSAWFPSSTATKNGPTDCSNEVP